MMKKYRTTIRSAFNVFMVDKVRLTRGVPSLPSLGRGVLVGLYLTYIPINKIKNKKIVELTTWYDSYNYIC